MSVEGVGRASSSWKDEAACRDVYQFTELTVTQQLAVCRGANGGEPCPVIQQCLELGLQQPLHIAGRIGFVFGGIEPWRLRQLYNRRQQAKAGAA
jgi:hypothetical protein